MKKGIITLFAILPFSLIVFKLFKRKKQPKKTGSKLKREDFIKIILPYAKEAENKIGIPFEFIIAQTGLETAWGKSSLLTKGFNFGGIKAKKGEPFIESLTYEYTDDLNKFPRRVYEEKRGNKWLVRTPEKFAKYKNMTEGFYKYLQVLQNKYFREYIKKANGNPYLYVELLQSKKPTYATDVNYVIKMKKIINDVQEFLHQNKLK